jgi:ribonuclease Z
MVSTKLAIATLIAGGLVGAAALTLDVDIRLKASTAHAAAGVPATQARLDRDVYYPGTEEIAADEMRVVACGTGMPLPRPKQAAACWLVELGNGDKFLFDIGAGSHENIAAQKIPYDYLDKVFIGHLHVDHFGDLGSFWLGGTTMNRLTPLNVWGPSGATEEYGTAYALEKMKEMYKWDIGTRSGLIDARGMTMNVTEFDYKSVNNVIYQENGVEIRTLPAIHALDGAVSFILEWNGLKFSFSSDTAPNRWWLEHTKGSDISIHESFLPPKLMRTKLKFTPLESLIVSTIVHTSPQQFGKIMELTRPRMAVGYHFQNDFDTLPTMIEETRKIYDGPLVFAEDGMVFNITKDKLTVRQSVIDEDIYAEPPVREKIPPPPNTTPAFSEFILGGAEKFPEVVGPIWEAMNEREGTNIKYPPSPE